MSNKALGANLMPVLAAVGALLLIGAITLLLTGQGSGGGSASVLQNAQGSILAARTALQSGSQSDFQALMQARSAMAQQNTKGLTTEQAKALRNLSQGLNTIEKNWPSRELLSAVSAEFDALVEELDFAATEIEGQLSARDRTAVTAQLDRLRLLGDGLRTGVQSLTNSNEAPSEVSQQLLDREMALSQIANAFQSGDPLLGLTGPTNESMTATRDSLSNITARVSDSVRNVLAISEDLASLHAVAQQFNGLEAALSGSVTDDSAEGNNNLLATILAAATMLILAAMAWLWFRQRDMREESDRQTEQTERNQAAIMRLLDELGSLADGDLTVSATVTEDITGAIADSINYAIEALRELVATLNDSAIKVDGAVRQTDSTAQQLAAASAEQSKQIEDASNAILSMASSIEEISGNAERSADVARHSVDVAHKGGDAVRRTIEGMNTIRETIQDTSKRIKRLGESSQEIGNIIELINDIADQTNILALNASIQASMAGEAGRGFAVVADEVQRLAERSANATKQIEVLVRTIQTDTNEAVVSMERSTTDVVGGALLAENAGAALEEIEQVSNQIASLVQNISGSSREQSSAAAAVTRNVDMLQEINSRTELSTSATTGSIRELAELAGQLRESVAGFRLPEEGAQVEEVSEYLSEEDSYTEFADPLIAQESDDVDYIDQQTA